MATEVNHDERRRLIVSKSVGLFAKLGYSKVSFLDISKATGIARTVLYRYFKTKREVFDAAIHEVTSEIRQEFERICSNDRTVTAKLQDCCAAVIDTFYGRRDFFAAIYEFVFTMVRSGEDMTDRIDMFTGGFKVVLGRLVKEGVASGELRDIDAADAAEALYALMESVALRVMLGTERDSARAKRRVRTMLRALAR